MRGATTASMTFNDGHILQYTYDADGRKLKAEYLLSGMHFLDWDVKKVSPAALDEVIERPSLIVKPATGHCAVLRESRIPQRCA